MTLCSGECVSMRLAERGTCLSNGLWVRERRKLTDSDHQSAILATDYQSNRVPLAGAMFARWSQENFFKYARENFSLDRLIDYRTQEISEPIRVVNPAYRKLDGELRSVLSKLNRVLAQFGARSIDKDIEREHIEPLLRQKAALQEHIEQLQSEVTALKQKRKATPPHRVQGSARRGALSPAEHPQQTSDRHHQMITYRAKTAMANVLREKLSRPDDTRSLLQALYTTEADLIPDYQEQTLTVRLHHMANGYSNDAISKLCDELNATETLFPRTNLRLVLKLGAP